VNKPTRRGFDRKIRSPRLVLVPAKKYPMPRQQMKRRKVDQIGPSAGEGQTGRSKKSRNMAKRSADPVGADPNGTQEDAAVPNQTGSGNEDAGAGQDAGIGAGGETEARSGSDPVDPNLDPQTQQSVLRGVQATVVERSGERSFRTGVRVEVLWKGQWNGWYAGVVTDYSSERDEYRVDYDDGKHDWHPAGQMRSAAGKAKMSAAELKAFHKRGGCAFLSTSEAVKAGAAVARGTARTCLADALWSALKTAGVHVTVKEVRSKMSAKFQDPCVLDAARYTALVGARMELVQKLSGSAFNLFNQRVGSYLVRLELRSEDQRFFHFVAYDASTGRLLDNDLGQVPVIEDADRADRAAAIATIVAIYRHVTEVRIRDVWVVSAC